jgi:hypothetical protein
VAENARHCAKKKRGVVGMKTHSAFAVIPLYTRKSKSCQALFSTFFHIFPDYISQE